MSKERQVCFAITLGKLIISENKKIADSRREVFLTPIDKWIRNFETGDTIEDMAKRIAPQILMTERGLTDLVLNGINDTVQKMGIWSYHLERDKGSNLMFLIGRI